MMHRLSQPRSAINAAIVMAAGLALLPAIAAAQVTPPAGAAPATATGPQAAAPAAVTAGTATPGAPAPGTPAPGAAAPGTPVAAGPVVKSAAPEEANPFSNVKATDDRSVKQELPVLEQRLKVMEDKMSQIQQVQAVLPADALGTGGGRGVGGGPANGAGGQDSMELEASTFVACVNGKALFRDADQKPFFVNAKEASQNEAVRRIGGCKH